MNCHITPYIHLFWVKKVWKFFPCIAKKEACKIYHSNMSISFELIIFVFYLKGKSSILKTTMCSCSHCTNAVVHKMEYFEDDSLASTSPQPPFSSEDRFRLNSIETKGRWIMIMPKPRFLIMVRFYECKNIYITSFYTYTRYRKW